MSNDAAVVRVITPNSKFNVNNFKYFNSDTTLFAAMLVTASAAWSSIKAILLSGLVPLATYQGWYLKWYLPDFVNIIDRHTTHLAIRNLSFLENVGRAAIILSMLFNLIRLKGELFGKEHVDLKGNKTKKYRPVKAGFTLAYLAAATVSYLSWFTLHLSAISLPAFIAMAAINTGRGAYSLGKNLISLYQKKQALEQRGEKISFSSMLLGQTRYDKNHATGKNDVNEELEYAELQYQRAKIMRSTFDVTLGLCMIGCTVLWGVNPIAGVAGCALLGLVYFAGRKYFTAKAQHYKSQSQKLHSAKKLSKTTEKVEDFKFFTHFIPIKKKKPYVPEQPTCPSYQYQAI